LNAAQLLGLDPAGAYCAPRDPLTAAQPAAMDLLQQYRWPGNVRELEHVIVRVLIMASGASIAVADLPPEMLPASAISSKSGAKDTLDDAEKRHILQAIEDCGGNQVTAAKRLGVARNTLWRKLKTYGIPAKKK
ncbi:MAG: helix-turn-helix domain-containing protein, partial [Elusimicrobiota bacterium]